MKIYYTNQFKKDYKRIKKQNKDINKLRIVIEKLVVKEPFLGIAHSVGLADDCKQPCEGSKPSQGLVNSDSTF